MNAFLRKALHGGRLLSLLALAALSVNAAQAATISKQNFMDLMAHSDSILVGTVTKVSDGSFRGLPYTEITLDVGQNIKGDHGSRYSFRQFGLIEPKAMGNGRMNLMVTPQGWPTYVKGERVLLFLHKPASDTGFQTTAGLTQGKFTIRGNRVVNGLDNEALFAGVRINANLSQSQRDLVNQTSGSYAAEEFFSLVRRAVEENWIANGVMSHDK